MRPVEDRVVEIGSPGWIRTINRPLQRRVLYIELRGNCGMVLPAGAAPA